ncbi:MAG: NAD-dependent epimerase/dehydratase family protein [bacterium]|nr:NAD-dependent epimerase/dehydratase family protein [bacterium]
MRVLITGGAGFIGSHIQDKYIGLGHHVTVLDNFSTGKREYLNPLSTLIEGDITDESTVRGVFQKGKFDLINHHAAQINIRYSYDDPINDCRVNVIGTLNLLKAMIDFKVPKIIFASTGGAIYGSPQTLPADESTPPVPGSPYAISKLTCENYIRNLSELYGFRYTIFRYANVYGPRQIAKGEAGVVAIYTERLLHGKSPVIFGTGDHTRDYVFVEDVARANALALENGDGNIFNIGCGVETNVRDVYDAVSKAFGDTALDAKIGDPVPEVERIALDASHAKKVLGWTPTIDFESGVLKTVKSFGVDVSD